MDRKKTQNVDRTGLSEASSFLLVIPGGKQSVFPGDKVYAGIGQEVSTLTQWRDFIPANVPNLCVVKYADVKHWNGSIVHTEAGG